jgi:hypothetical protein
MKEGSLFVCLTGWDLPMHRVPLATLLVWLESSRWVRRVHPIGFKMFQPTMENLLNVEEKKNHWKFVEIKTKRFIRKFGHTLDLVGKLLVSRDLMNVIWKFLDLRWRSRRYWILSNFSHWKFNSIQLLKNGFGRKVLVGNQFTLGPTT